MFSYRTASTPPVTMRVLRDVPSFTVCPYGTGYPSRPDTLTPRFIFHGSSTMLVSKADHRELMYTLSFGPLWNPDHSVTGAPSHEVQPYVVRSGLGSPFVLTELSRFCVQSFHATFARIDHRLLNRLLANNSIPLYWREYPGRFVLTA